MTSQRKVLANRANAAKSTGPKTVAGKSRARFNSLKDGIFAMSHLLPSEDEDAYERLAASVFEEYQPDGPVAEQLAKQVVRSLWQLERLEKAERAALLRIEVDAAEHEGMNDLEVAMLGHHHVDDLLREKLSDKKTQRCQIQSEGSNGDDPKVLVRKVKSVGGSRGSRSIPADYTFLKGYADPIGNRPNIEVDRQRRALLKDLQALDSLLIRMRERRRTVTVPVMENADAKSDDMRSSLPTTEELQRKSSLEYEYADHETQ